MVSPKDGKRYSTDVADMALMFRIIESIPSKKAEPFGALGGTLLLAQQLRA